MPLAGSDQHPKRPATAVGGQVDLGGQSAAAAPQGLIAVGIGAYVGTGSPFRAPAACWWARTTVASTTTSQSTSPTTSDLVWT
jgi:hypothetical protein